MNSKNNIPYGLVLHPSIEEFSSPREFVERLDKNQALSDYGIVKVFKDSQIKEANFA